MAHRDDHVDAAVGHGVERHRRAARSRVAGRRHTPGTVGAADNWPIWGGDAGGTKYSHLDEINTDNVAELQPVWTWATGEQPVRGGSALITGKGVRPGNFEATALVIDGTMFLSTPYNRVVALDAASGEELWSYDPRAWEWGQSRRTAPGRCTVVWRCGRARSARPPSAASS